MRARISLSSRNGLVVLCLAVVLIPQSAWGTQTWQFLEAQVNLGAQNTFQHDSDHFEWVQERNELRTDLTSHFLADHKLFDRLAIPGVEDGIVQAVYRARFDAVYQARERFNSDLYPDAGLRGNLMYPEGSDIRELFFDLRFGKIGPGNLSARLGKQQVVWGEADLFRSLDVVNPLRLDQNFLLGENFDDFRRPLEIAKFLYDVGQVGPVANVGIEALWTPRQAPLTRDLIFEEAFGLPFDPVHRSSRLPYRAVRNPWSISRIGPGLTEAPDRASFGSGQFLDLIYLTDDQAPHGTKFNDPEAGLRVLGQLWGADFTLNYLFKRAELPGTGIHWATLFDPKTGKPRFGHVNNTLAGCLAGKPSIVPGSVRGYKDSIATACLPIFFWYPQTHIIGGTATYNEAKYTGLIWRTEQSVSTEEPRNRVPALVGPRAGQLPNAQDFASENRTHTFVWRSMIGFDWLKAFPWMPITRHDQWLLSMQLLTEYYATTAGQMGILDAPSQPMRRWNNTLTFLGTGFFMAGKLRPQIAAGYDMEAQFPVLWAKADYHFTPRLTVQISTTQYMGSQLSNSHLFLQKFADRDTTSLRFVYSLL
jgi:hypothetical protein